MIKKEICNYQPLTILMSVSKVFERVIYCYVESYLDQKKLLFKFQSGFRSRYSTDTCLTHLTDVIKFQIDQGHFFGTVLLDLQNLLTQLIMAFLMKL